MRVQRLTLMALLVALSVVGAFVKLGPWTIALDSAPGFFAALMIGPAEGALVCLLGHLASAGATGFPLTLPFHLAVALIMAGVGAAGSYTARRYGRLAGTLVLVLLNGVGSPALLALLPNPMGRSLFAAMVLPLTIAAAANGAVAWAGAAALTRAKVMS